ncbi:MAG: ribosomal protein [Armatimonadetes bacterium]|nr:ribosomal protein [Armatimonadota bacterium]
MKVILKADVRDLGHTGELVEVKQGYARNFLLPRALAIPATEGNVKDYQKRISAAKQREERERTAAQQVADNLRGKRVVIIHRPVEGGTRIHGSITSVEIAKVLSGMAGREIDRRDVDLRTPIRALGDYRVNVKLMRGLSVQVPVLVAEKEPVEEVPAAAEEPAAEAEATAAA